MNWSRREFLGSAVSAGALQAAPAQYFGLHPFIEANPKAVFVQRTKVPHKMDAAAKKNAGLKLAREIFVPSHTPGTPLSHRILLKPNITSVRSRNRPDVDNWGTGTDPDFYEGVIMGLKEVGLKKFHFAETNLYHSWHYRGFADIHARHGVVESEPEQHFDTPRAEREIVWSKVPDAVIYSRIPHHWPVGQSDTWLLNIAKWKGHSMCLTQSVKNEQGLVILPFIRFCSGMQMVTGVPQHMKQHMCAEAGERATRYFENHRRMGYKRYEAEPGGKVSPLAQEIWAHKTCDNQSVMKTGLAMIEGIYGRDGDGFGIGNDYLTNLVMFSKDKFRLDLIGLWLGGHEPGNVYLYRIAKERGLTDTFNPWEVPVYEWIDGQPVQRKLTDFPRHELKSIYLQMPGEPFLHLANERFDYDKVRA
ncbi:MAG: DUF362 domain-containing protein [Acidobacteria bacterium]|nr:DUF362 domain-containing protein [Acidobacteriota bacterium]